MATFFTGLCTLPRAVLYIAAQVVGAIVGSYFLRLGLGDAFFPTEVIPGCTIDTRYCSVGQMWVMEFMLSQVLIFIAFGVGLDPRQAKVFGAALAPILVGSSLALATLAGSIVNRGYSGVSFNPARCIGLMTAKGFLQYHWVHWTAPLAAAMLNGLFYQFAPPYVRDKPLIQYNPLHRSV
ncbi:hypothetical protein LTR37_012582 [Vermiconidia calcicola]|uniref:Uncharacterized protein n=1 Tax=Vermiconidia calcicola TaxID=1690605 RepID=A0ACC3N026_9PEZI|nr:hypothetical protein LTR37_012582 [Vermiconidia calcicola]